MARGERGSGSPAGTPQPLFVRGDIDGFFGLAIDNLVQFLLIYKLWTDLLKFPEDLLLSRVFPGAALSIIVGNFFYARQAQKLSAATGRRDVTALPYGINTVSLFAFIIFVMLPVKLDPANADATPRQLATLAWQLGLAACFFSGLIELVGSFVAEKIRQLTPRAALLSTLAGIAISFIAIGFAIETFEQPIVAMLPLGVVLTTYFARIRLPFRIPGGAWALLLGTAVAWVIYALAGAGESPVNVAAVTKASGDIGFYLPIPVLGDLVAGLQNPTVLKYLVPVILPMGLFNVLGSLQNIESAEAAGDRYPTMPSMAVNGAGSMVAAVLGSCFPTTIYIGHPGWKGLGARSGYSILNGIFFAVLALFGLTSLVKAIVPMEAGMAIVIWIGVVITAQAFQATPRSHAPAVAFGLFPAIASWGLVILGGTLAAAQLATQDFGLAAKILAEPKAFLDAGIHLSGLVALSQGFMITCMVWAAASTHLIERQFLSATVWVLIGAVASFVGFIHAGSMTPSGAVYDIGLATGWRWSVGYLLCALFFAVMHLWSRNREPLEHGH